ncbi:hypothetical protein PINS_up018273 [Pythium insidiosum]|nr:hypothetical protein PINS_up018273 [Pythium insidiosum]
MEFRFSEDDDLQRRTTERDDEEDQVSVRLNNVNDIIERVQRNTRMTPTEKKRVKDEVRRSFKLEAIIEARRRGLEQRKLELRAAARAIRKGGGRREWQSVLGQMSPDSDVSCSDDDLDLKQRYEKFLGPPPTKQDRMTTRIERLEAELEQKSSSESVTNRNNAQDDNFAHTKTKTSEDAQNQIETSADGLVRTKTSEDAATKATTSEAMDAVSKDASDVKKSETCMMSYERPQHHDASEWIIDSGCSSHMCKTLDYFITFSTWGGQFVSAANPLSILRKCTVRFYATDKEGQQQLVELKNVYYVPRVACNLLSVAKAQNMDGYDVLFKDKTCVLYHRGGGHTQVAPISRTVDLYVLRAKGKELALLAKESRGMQLMGSCNGTGY